MILCPHYVHGLYNARGPGGGRERAHDAGGSEDRDAPDDAEPGVGRLLGHLFAVRDAYYNAHASGVRVDDLAHGGGDHGSRGVVYRGSADRQAESGLGHGSNALAPI